jgi:hypothetical protein
VGGGDDAYVHGVSTRKVDDLVQALATEAGISKSESVGYAPSSTPWRLSFGTGGWGTSSLPPCSSTPPTKAHEGAKVVSKAIVIATGVARSGDRGVLGLAVGDSEDRLLDGLPALPTSSSSPPSRSPTGGRCGRRIRWKRVIVEIKRRAGVVGIFASENWVLRLAGAVLLEIHHEWTAAERCYLSAPGELYKIRQDDNPKEVDGAHSPLVA